MTGLNSDNVTFLSSQCIAPNYKIQVGQNPYSYPNNAEKTFIIP